MCRFHEDLVRDVKEAKKQIDIQHMYFHPSPKLLSALIDASNRGVVVNLFTNRDGGDMPFTHKLFAEISRSNWKALFEGKEKRNVNIHEFNVAHTTYHKKVICVDGQSTYIGSSNIGKKSLEMSDQEMNVRLDSSQFGAQIQQIVTEDRSLFIKVADSEAPNIRIDQAAIAQALDFVLKPWL